MEFQTNYHKYLKSLVPVQCGKANFNGNSDLKNAEMQKVNTFTRAAFLGSKNLHQKVRDSQQIQRYQKCVIRDISKPNRLENSVKHQERVKNTRKQCETE